MIWGVELMFVLVIHHDFAVGKKRIYFHVYHDGTDWE